MVENARGDLCDELCEKLCEERASSRTSALERGPKTSRKEQEQKTNRKAVERALFLPLCARKRRARAYAPLSSCCGAGRGTAAGVRGGQADARRAGAQGVSPVPRVPLHGAALGLVVWNVVVVVVVCVCVWRCVCSCGAACCALCLCVGVACECLRASGPYRTAALHRACRACKACRPCCPRLAFRPLPAVRRLFRAQRASM